MPAEVGHPLARHLPDIAGHQVDGPAQGGVEDADVEQAAAGTGGELAACLLLVAKAFDLLEVPDRRPPGEMCIRDSS